MRTHHAATLSLGFLLAACNGCKSGGGQLSPPPGVTLQKLTVTSRNFPYDGAIPVDFTCDGADKSPQLTWSAPPAGTRALAIVADDPDAPGGDFIHWVAFDVRGDVLTIPEAADIGSLGGAVGTNGFNRLGYSGPCPPKMELHAYRFHVYALDAPVTAKPGATADALDSAMNGHVLAAGVLVGTFSR